MSGYFTNNPEGARAAFQRLCGLHRAAFWAAQGHPNLVRARAVHAENLKRRRIEKWKREELKRTPFADCLDIPPEVLKPKKRRH